MADIDWSSLVDWEVVTFFILVLAFALWERLRPARDVNRFAELKLDLLSFALAVLMARLSRRAVDTLVDAVSPGFVLSSLETIRGWPGVVKIALALVVVDFIIYWIHRAQHRSEFMWRTHKWHHSIQEMYWFSGFRTSFAHSFLYNIPQTVIPMHLFHLSPWQAGVGYSIGLFIQFWEHTNVRVNIGWLRHIFITPQYHRVHHAATTYRNMNFGTTFSLWDRMFGTYVDPEGLPENYALGLDQKVQRQEIPRMFLGL
jgi:sterol desaturase/sphingolipid hydroxylase (fatty acid hydroxylase superfamily)